MTTYIQTTAKRIHKVQLVQGALYSCSLDVCCHSHKDTLTIVKEPCIECMLSFSQRIHKVRIVKEPCIAVVWMYVVILTKNTSKLTIVKEPCIAVVWMYVVILTKNS